MLDPLASAIGGFAMALKGQFTGKALVNYLRDDGTFSYAQARRVINGDTQNYKAVSEYCRSYERALQKAEAAVPDWLTNALPATSPEPVIIHAPAEIDFGQATEKALLSLITLATSELAARGGHELTSHHHQPQSAAPVIDGDFLPVNDEAPDNSGVNPMKQIDGLKTYIVAIVAAAIGISEGLLGVDIPGAEMQENWVEYVLGAAGLGSVRHAIAKLINGIRGR